MTPPHENRVFVSYSQDSPEHQERIRQLVEQLRRDGVDCRFDLYEQNPSEPLPRWMERQIREARYVLVACTETYWRRAAGLEVPGIGLGVKFENLLILNEIFVQGGQTDKFVPLIWELTDRLFIPEPLKGYTYYEPVARGGYEKLLRFLTGQPKYRAPELGPLPDLRPAPPTPPLVAEGSSHTPLARPAPTPTEPVKPAKTLDSHPSPSALINAWLTLEALAPRALPNAVEAAAQRRRLIRLEREGAPWLRPQPATLPLAAQVNPDDQRESTFWILYLGELDLRAASEALLKIFPDPHASERTGFSGSAALAAVVLDSHGKPLLERLTVASFGWSYGQVLAGQLKQLGRFPEEEKELRSQLRKKLSVLDEAGQTLPLTRDSITEVTTWLVETLGLPSRQVNVQGVTVQVVQRGRAAEEPPEPELLNSFFLEDLVHVEEACRKNRAGAALRRYLGASAGPARTDVLGRSTALEERLAPAQLALARWPSAHSLNALQQAAVNHVLLDLQEEGMVGVNGPPGTGKTTLLRDVIANIVVTRALALATFKKPKAAFVKHGTIEVGTTQRTCFDLAPRLRGHEIVVASSNNRAVENITAELPSLGALPEGDSLRYLPGFADALVEARAQGARVNPCWGLVSAVLGNAANLRLFVESFWWRKDHGFQAYLRQLQERWELPAEDPQAPASSASGETPPRSRREAEARWQEAREGLLAAKLAVTRQVEALLKPSLVTKVPGALWSQPFEDLLTLTPSAGQNLQAARAELFRASFRVHRAFLDLVGQPLRQNLGLLMDVLQGRVQLAELEAVRASLWATLFLVVPVLSTTFASFARLFGRLGREELGWLLIDEAGQALPQAAVGAIWRSRRVVALGDPLQIEPVTSLPPQLVAALCREHQVDERVWAGPLASVQTLADRASWFGTTVDHGSGETWMGAPLRVHRRCEEPMFSVVNEVAYGGSMIDATPVKASPIGDVLGDSGWFAVETAKEGKWVPEEGAKAGELLWQCIRELRSEAPDLFFITPFRLVAQSLREALEPALEGLFARREDRQAWIKTHVGTIHTFQGKEAEAVVLVLGARGSSEHGARTWAGSRPNLLNVAVSRARQRLYVVGDRTAWRKEGFFRTLAHYLPVR
jgi:energy-coupling factor transporter ATP-binding protein EcfA2